MKEKRKQSIRLCGLLSLLLLLALLGGCKKKENTEAKTDEEGYQIYYLNKDETATATVNYQPEAKDTDGGRFPGSCADRQRFCDRLYAGQWAADPAFRSGLSGYGLDSGDSLPLRSGADALPDSGCGVCVISDWG